MNLNNHGISFSEVINGEKKSRHYSEVIYLEICCECSRDHQICAWNFLGKGKPKIRFLIHSQCQAPDHKAESSED